MSAPLPMEEHTMTPQALEELCAALTADALAVVDRAQPVADHENCIRMLDHEVM